MSNGEDFTIGVDAQSNTVFYKGDFFDIIVFDSVLSSYDLAQAVNSLAKYYALGYTHFIGVGVDSNTKAVDYGSGNVTSGVLSFIQSNITVPSGAKVLYEEINTSGLTVDAAKESYANTPVRQIAGDPAKRFVAVCYGGNDINNYKTANPGATDSDLSNVCKAAFDELFDLWNRTGQDLYLVGPVPHTRNQSACELAASEMVSEKATFGWVNVINPDTLPLTSAGISPQPSVDFFAIDDLHMNDTGQGKIGAELAAQAEAKFGWAA
jgi:lysophospholipase L1-like esterase